MQKSNNGALFAAIAFIITLGAFVVAWKFIIPSYQENKKEIAQLEVDIQQAKDKLDSINRARESLTSLGDTVNQMLVSIPKDKDTPNLITELEVLGNNYKLTIPAIQISDSASSADPTAVNSSNNKVSVSFAVTGSFENLNALLADLEKDIRFMNITTVSLSKAESVDGKSTDLSMGVKLNAYKYIDTSLSTSVESNLSNTSATN